jgi:hypothetical protein
MYQKPFAYDNALLCFTSIGTFEPLTFCHKTYYTIKKTFQSDPWNVCGVRKLGFEKLEENQLHISLRRFADFLH